MQILEESREDVGVVAYRAFHDGPSKNQWKKAGTGFYEGLDGIEGEVGVKIVPFAELYQHEFILIPGGNGCKQVYEVSNYSWVRDLKTGTRGIALNSHIRRIEENLDQLKL